ncbi:VWA domain-containing protein [Shewanella sp. A25]|nr:VWA domain-containing protein [Shewanella shenzhenensis]
MTLHFIRPEWLLALIPLLLVVWQLWRQHESHSAWNRYIAPHLAKILVTQGKQQSRRPLHLLTFTWIIATIALAGPAVNKQSLPVFAAEQGRVLIMDMSLSMLATDLTPNRLTQAKFRATDLINSLKEGETGLIAFAGDAFTISPLTRDTGTLLNLLPTLSPEIMPVQGSNLEAALTQAKNLLAQGGHIRGDIILMTDGISDKQYNESNAVLAGTQYRLAILGFGSQQGAPIRLPDGQLQRDNSNEVVVAKTDFELLQRLANNNAGVLIQNRADGKDLSQLQAWLSDSGDAKATDVDGETWQDLGPYLALLLLLPALLSFRHGVVATITLMLSSLVLTAAPQQAQANVWNDLWQTQEQQAMDAYKAEDYDKAAKQFETPQWQGSAQYKAGDFEQALKSFEQDGSANGLYNQGNALMQLGQIDKALERYQSALEKQPDFPKAKANRELAEKLLNQQSEQNQSNPQDQQDKQNQDQQSQQDQSQQNSQDQQSGQDQQSDDQQSQDQQSQQSQSGEQDKQNESQQNQADDAENQSGQQNDEQLSDQQQGDEQQDNSADNDKQSSDNAQQQEDEAQANQNNADSTQNEASNEAKMQATPEEQKSADSEQKVAPATQGEDAAPADSAKDKEQGSINEALDTPPSNSEPMPATMERALRGVSEDPQVLLRNKMQLEYQKRRQNGQITRDKEQW